MTAAGHAAMLRTRVATGEPNPQRATNISIGAAVVALVNAFTQLLLSFGLSLTAQQQVSIQAVINAVILVVLAASHVYTAGTVEREAKNGKH